MIERLYYQYNQNRKSIIWDHSFRADINSKSDGRCGYEHGNVGSWGMECPDVGPKCITFGMSEYGP
jgi:hypothetical protein